MPNKRLTEDQIREAAKNSYSLAEMCRQLGLIPAGGNYASMKRRITRYDIDVSHFTGQGWNKDNYKDQPNKKTSIKKKLIRERGHQCQKCKNTTWFDLPITLELEHVDGNNSNNIEENLLLLCPNCHAQTKTWRRAKSSFEQNPKIICPICNAPKGYKAKTCSKCYQDGSSGRKQEIAENARSRRTTPAENFCSCGATISSKGKKCKKCSYKDQQRIVWPEPDAIVIKLRDNRETYISVAKSLGVTANSIRRHLKRNNIDPKTFQPLDKETDDQ